MGAGGSNFVKLSPDRIKMTVTHIPVADSKRRTDSTDSGGSVHMVGEIHILIGHTTCLQNASQAGCPIGFAIYSCGPGQCLLPRRANRNGLQSHRGAGIVRFDVPVDASDLTVGFKSNVSQTPVGDYSPMGSFPSHPVCAFRFTDP